jgi:hypothetical protein
MFVTYFLSFCQTAAIRQRKVTLRGSSCFQFVTANFTKREQILDFLVFCLLWHSLVYCGTRLASYLSVTRMSGDCHRSFSWVVRRWQSGATRHPVSSQSLLLPQISSSTTPPTGTPEEITKSGDRTKNQKSRTKNLPTNSPTNFPSA